MRPKIGEVVGTALVVLSIGVHMSACPDVMRFAVCEIEASAITMRSNAPTTDTGLAKSLCSVSVMSHV